MNISKEKINNKFRLIILQWQNRKFKTRSLHKQLLLKKSHFRKTLAVLLKLWKIHRSLIIISNLYNVRPKFLSKILQHSRFFRNRKNKRYGRKMRTTIEWKRKLKRGELRNKIALCLKTWKKLRSIDETAKTLGMKRMLVTEYLRGSNVYTNRRKYKTSEKEYAYTWAWKLIAIETLGGKCKKCGNNNPITLELHHADKKQKEKCFSDMIRKNKYSHEAIKKEIKKCQLLCRNCHQELHNQNKHPKNLKNKKFILNIQNNKGKCVLCGYNKNISCLEFHHKNKANKKFQLSMLTDPRRNYNATRIKKEKFNFYIKEIKKCMAICCNCHQIIHTKTEKVKDLGLLIQITKRLMSRNYGWRN